MSTVERKRAPSSNSEASERHSSPSNTGGVTAKPRSSRDSVRAVQSMRCTGSWTLVVMDVQRPDAARREPYRLIGPDGIPYESRTKGTLGGLRGTRIYGRL